ncbi:MAG: hypothetical protein QM734_02710 [Cyclobacteriaceae bacterium]
MKRILTSTLIVILCVSFSSAQNLLNKLKDKATQEVKKLENGASSKNTQSNKSKLSSNVSRTVAVSLNADEVFDYSENCIDLGTSFSQISFIVNKRVGNTIQCFSYKNGVRMPTSCPTNYGNCAGSLQCSQYKLKEVNPNDAEGKKYVTTKTESHSAAAPAISDQQLKMMQAYMTAEQIEQVKKQMAEAAKQTQGQTYETPISSTINFNGKQYGPYKQLLQFFLTQDGKNFYAIVADDTQTGVPPVYKIITSISSAVLTAPGYSPPVIIATPDASEFAMYAISNDQKHSIVTSAGKTYSLPSNASYTSWYSGKHIVSFSQTYSSNIQLYLDGQSIKTYPNTAIPDACNLYVTPDGKVTEVKNNIISFGDGDYYEYPLKISLVEENGKSYFKWLALENREVVVYQKPN